jgi:hypothetical protein
VTVSADTFEFFLLDRHLDAMTQIVIELGDDLVNVAPPLPGANSPHALLFHTAGMLEWWIGHVVMGREVRRDRAAEFRSSGAVAELVDRVSAVRKQAAADLAVIDLDDPPRGSPSPDYLGTPIAQTVGGALLHVLEELAQHHGHLEISRDLIVATQC